MDSTIQVHMAKGKPQSSPAVAIWASHGPRRIVAVPYRLDATRSQYAAPGGTKTATMRHPLVPKLKVDALPHRMPMGRGREAHRER